VVTVRRAEPYPASAVPLSGAHDLQSREVLPPGPDGLKVDIAADEVLLVRSFLRNIKAQPAGTFTTPGFFTPANPEMG
jgi:hypothetical protein